MNFRISKPTLLLSKDICLANINRMAAKAAQHGLIFRPHFKTHQSAEIGEWFRDAGVSSIAVSSVRMAKYFADAGWNDITIAFPVNILEIDQIILLSSRISLNLLVVSKDATRFLSGTLHQNTGIFIEIDTGYHRTGLLPGETDEIDQIIAICETSRHLKFRGFLCHAGNTYTSGGSDKIREIHFHSINILKHLKNRFETNIRKIFISYGDTPSCSLMNNFDGIDEIRPGNFVFYDIMQNKLGSCSREQIAVALVCPVVAKYPQRGEIVIYGGIVHLSREFLIQADGSPVYGLAVKWNERGWSIPGKDCFVKSLSQEHGIVNIDENLLKEIEPGDLIGILPVHSCITASCMKGYRTIDGQQIAHLEAHTSVL